MLEKSAGSSSPMSAANQLSKEEDGEGSGGGGKGGGGGQRGERRGV